MRSVRLALLPLVFAACDRQPAAPDIHMGPEFRATSEWIEFEVPYGEEGWNWGPVECLPGTPDAIAFGTVIVKIHTVTTPNGKVVERFWNPGWTEDHYLLIDGVVWALARMVRHGVLFYEEGAPVKVHQGNPIFRYINQDTGATLDWTLSGQIKFNEMGEPVLEHLWGKCEVTP